MLDVVALYMYDFMYSYIGKVKGPDKICTTHAITHYAEPQ